ncbi:relaxase/mobilization nuclease domain-containing protein [uncultured Paracoccus sp.]|uniref:relaxase/mobilization nuclease domain-containing protein n=1 Tax=uncultured Paracoccus sp. TaxID=189685 RepID=UPI002616E835|nr:relaxase/mobilization nuclease domain-containing protein [uncultured Paracoccus sp.]
MILKGNQRAGAADLATHLSNEYDNERIEIAQVRGTVADELHGAFAEIEAVASGTRCKEPLYSLAINPVAPISREQYFVAIDHIEDKLGLSGQPRAVVFHVKSGREHCHVVWSRIDLDTMKAIPLSHDRMRLRTCARELAHAYGLTLPAGLAEDRGDARFERNRDVTFAEKAMAEASGITPEQRRADITTLFRSSDSAESFRAGLERSGYVLAQGERRAYVVVDRAGHVHALARQIDGVRTKDVKSRLADLPAERLPTVEQAKTQQRARQSAVDERLREKARARGAKSAADLKAKQEARRRRTIDGRRQALEVTHRAERLSLSAAHKAEEGHLFNVIAGKVFALFERVPALRSVIAHLRSNPAIDAAERHRQEDEALDRRHERESKAIDRRAAALDKIEARERRGLIRDLVKQTRVDDIQRQAKTEQREREARETAHDITTAKPSHEQRGAADERRARMQERLTQARQKPAGPHRGRPGWE